ncbi:MAG: Protein kinase, partial [bacterium]|nr:Protein kinase [bacterium]
MIGQVIAGRYEIVRLLGAGGMGAVYQARQLSMDRMVALELIHPHIASDDKGQLFLAMEFLEGRPLSRVLDGELEPSESPSARADGAMPQPRLVHIASQVVRALGVGPTPAALLVTHATAEPPSPSSVAPRRISPAFEAL